MALLVPFWSVISLLEGIENPPKFWIDVCVYLLWDVWLERQYKVGLTVCYKSYCTVRLINTQWMGLHSLSLYIWEPSTMRGISVASFALCNIPHSSPHSSYNLENQAPASLLLYLKWDSERFCLQIDTLCQRLFRKRTIGILKK